MKKAEGGGIAVIFYGDRIIKRTKVSEQSFKCSPSILGRRPALCLTSIVRAGATRNLASAACTPYGSTPFGIIEILTRCMLFVKRPCIECFVPILQRSCECEFLAAGFFAMKQKRDIFGTLCGIYLICKREKFV